MTFAKEAAGLGGDYQPQPAQLETCDQTVLGGYFQSPSLAGLSHAPRRPLLSLYVTLFFHTKQRQKQEPVLQKQAIY